MGDIPHSHPRRASLLARQQLVDAAAAGLLADSALIAHGRGEAFDYLLGERTSDSARLAIREVAARLLAAERPVISVNGNTVVLAGKAAIRIAARLSCPIEVNLYYRTPERIEKLLTGLEEMRAEVASEAPPNDGTQAQWADSVKAIQILGAESDGRIEGLEGPRALCSRIGIEAADTVLVPLEDGDRCEALMALGKQVLVVDLNPLSRTARRATITIVDEVSRTLDLLSEALLMNPEPTDFDNSANLRAALQVMAESAERL